METLEALRRQRETVDEVHSVVRTMKGLAASRIRHYEAAVTALEGYARGVDLGLQILLRERPDAVQALRPAPDGPLAVIVIGSDQGLCGPFSRRIAEHAADHLEQEMPRTDRLVAAVGHRVRDELVAIGQRVDEQFPLPASVEGMTTAVRDLLLRIDEWRVDQHIARILLIHHQPVSRATYEPLVTTVAPLDPSRLARLANRPWEGPTLPMRFGPWDEVFRSLVSQDLFVALYRGFAGSLASENAARLAAMQAAERTIDERAEDLQRQYQRRRQEAITEELLDVVSGWEALGGR